MEEPESVNADDVHTQIDGLLQEYFGLYAELLSYMGQVEKHVRKGYSKFVLARADDPALLLGTGSYAGREMRPLVTIEEGSILKMKSRAPGTSVARVRPEKKYEKPSPLARLRQRALTKAAERDPKLKEIMQKKNMMQSRKAETTEDDDTKVLEDPVSWFGCLIPRDVRNAKKDFSLGLEKLLRVAELRRQMDKKENRIRKLKQQLVKAE